MYVFNNDYYRYRLYSYVQGSYHVSILILFNAPNNNFLTS